LDLQTLALLQRRCRLGYQPLPELFERADAEWKTRPSAERVEEYGRQIDNVRAALDWAFSPSGDASIGVALTIASVSLCSRRRLSEVETEIGNIIRHWRYMR
jgi:hypothetical protein